jgi:hypothetical protein
MGRTLSQLSLDRLGNQVMALLLSSLGLFLLLGCLLRVFGVLFSFGDRCSCTLWNKDGAKLGFGLVLLGLRFLFARLLMA